MYLKITTEYDNAGTLILLLGQFILTFLEKNLEKVIQQSAKFD